MSKQIQRQKAVSHDFVCYEINYFKTTSLHTTFYKTPQNNLH